MGEKISKKSRYGSQSIYGRHGCYDAYLSIHSKLVLVEKWNEEDVDGFREDRHANKRLLEAERERAIVERKTNRISEWDAMLDKGKVITLTNIFSVVIHLSDKEGEH